VVLPDCFDLTAGQVEALTGCLEAGTRLVVTDRFGESMPDAARESLLGHRAVCVGSVDDVTTLTPDGPQVTVSAPLAVNLHRLPDGVAVHLVNYDHDHERDGVRRTGEVELTVRLVGGGGVSQAVYRPADGAAEELSVQRDGDVIRIQVPDVGVYAVVELTEGAS
jgi:hypothetical protein